MSPKSDKEIELIFALRASLVSLVFFTAHPPARPERKAFPMLSPRCLDALTSARQTRR